tara:strand:+ start:288 stop:1235 length:948 start_codon:yes stop_codon:yes gene_type:complete
MEHYTRLNEQEIDEILQQFEMGPIVSVKLLDGGFENTNYLITSTTKKYILCICEQKAEQKAEELARILIHLDTQKFHTSKIIPQKNGQLFSVWKGKPIMIRSYVEGTVVANSSPHLLRLIGKEVAKLHLVRAPDFIPKQLNYGKEQFQNVKKYGANSEFERWLGKIVKYITPYLDLNLPKSLIHSDIFLDNVIISEDESAVTIIDFEESTYYFRVFDIGMTIIGTCADGKTINLEKVDYFLNAYQSKAPLTSDEINALKAFTIYAGASMTFWRHQNFNYTKPDPEMYNHYLGLQVLVDYVFALDDDSFSKLIKDK